MFRTYHFAGAEKYGESCGRTDARNEMKFQNADGVKVLGESFFAFW